jgi:hypothetical protein
VEKNCRNLGRERGRIRSLSEPDGVRKRAEEYKVLKWIFFQSRDVVKIIAQHDEWVV